MGFLWSQLFVTPAYPAESFAGQTVIVTGSNVGLGMEAARHIVRLGAEKVILAVRNIEAGEAAKENIEFSRQRPGVCEVWQLDLSSYESVKAFAAKAQSLPRIDVLLENAGIAPQTFKLAEKDESSITVNVVSTFLLALLMLPKLQETAQKFNTRPRLTIVSSEVHAMANFKERSAPEIFKTLSTPETADMADRYNVSKLLEVLVIRHIAPLLATGPYKDVVLNYINPGLCQSSLARDMNTWVIWIAMNVMKFLLARTTEVGSRTLVHAAAKGPESHGKYVYDGEVNDSEVAAWVRAEEGDKVAAKVWSELKVKLEGIVPGVTKSIK